VGVEVKVRHLAPTPVGGEVRVCAEILEVEGIKVKLGVQAWDGGELVGEGTHSRVVVEVLRFTQRVESKRGG
jgi:predicted thioesterase